MCRPLGKYLHWLRTWIGNTFVITESAGEIIWSLDIPRGHRAVIARVVCTKHWDSSCRSECSAGRGGLFVEVNRTLVSFCVVRRSDEEITLTRAVIRFIHTYHAGHLPCCAVGLRSCIQNMDWALQGHGMVCMNETRPHCVNKMRKTQYKLVGAPHGHGMGTAWYVWMKQGRTV